MASPSHQSPSVPERTGGHSAALQMRQRPLFLLMNSSHARVGSEGCTVVGVAFCTAGTLPGRSPRWPCAQLFLWQTWSKCSDDKIVHVLFFPFFFFFFFPLLTISSLQWRSHLFLLQPESRWMSGTLLHSHSHHVWGIKRTDM